MFFPSELVFLTFFFLWKDYFYRYFYNQEFLGIVGTTSIPLFQARNYGIV